MVTFHVLKDSVVQLETRIKTQDDKDWQSVTIFKAAPEEEAEEKWKDNLISRK